MKKSKMEIKCDKCGKLQTKNKEKPNVNWSVYDCKQKCECGGKFVLYMDGQKVG